MTSKTTNTSVTFRRPFSLPGMAELHPAGTYVVATDTETIDSVSNLAFRRVATRIFLTKPGTTEVWTVEPRDLEVALLRDAD